MEEKTYYPVLIDNLNSATTLTGNEELPTFQGGNTVKTPISSLPSAFNAGVVVFGSGAPFKNFRTLKAGTGIEIQDGGSQSDLVISSTSTGGGTWGSITGTLSNQTDLQAALNAKANTSSLATVATTGAYGDLSGKPTIPTLTSQLTNDSGYITSSALTPYTPTSRTITINGVTQDLSANRSWTIATGVSWGAITGTLSSQTDLQTALNAKGNLNGSLTANRVPYASGAATLSDNAYLYYDTTDSRLEVFSGLGSEKVTNGSFTGSAAGWTVGAGWAYSSNTMTKNSNGTGSLFQNISLVLGEEYIVSFTISAMTVSSVTVTLGGKTLGTITANGTYEYRVVPINSASLNFTPTNASRFTLDNVSARPLTGGSVATDSLGIGGANRSPATTKVSMNFSHSNGSAGTTRAIEFNNSGSNTWFDFNFAGINRSYLGANNSGGVDLWLSGGNYFSLYNKNTSSLYHYNTPSAMGHSGAGIFGISVAAGLFSQASSTLQSAGGTALKVRRVVSNTTLDNSATKWIANATSAACTGTASVACSSYTNSTDCLARDAHGGCSWFAGNDCGVFSYESGMSACISQSGCSASESSCAGASDQSSCEAQDDAYGGSCAWNNYPQSCSGFGDESTCTSYSGCTWYPETTGDCSAFDGDQATCESTSGCSWSDPTCSGTYVITSAYCDGSYDSYTCDGNYYNGVCSGLYGANCNGTPSCLGIDDQTNCNAETGCTWSTAVNLTLPAITTCPDRDYWVYKDGAGGTVNIYPNGTDKVNGTTSYTLSADKEWVHISPYRESASCSVYWPSNQSTCNSTSGCTVETNSCSWNSMDNTCSGNAVCTGISDQPTCEATTYYSGCNGSYAVISNWFKFGS